MDAQTIVSIVQGVGFPIVMCGAMGWFVKYMYDKFMAQMNGQNERHAKEMEIVNSALDNNTAALSSMEKSIAVLTSKIGGTP